MKRLFALVFTLFAVQSASAGTAFINNFQADPTGYSCYRFTNISKEEGTLKITLFDGAGNVFTGGTHGHAYFTGLDQTFAVPAKATATFCTLHANPFVIGHGVVKSSNTEAGRKQFIGIGLYHTANMSYSIPINNDRPF